MRFVARAASSGSLSLMAMFALVSACVGASAAHAQTVSLLGGMHLSLGPPEGQVIGAPTEVTTAPPQGADTNTVYIVETQAPPGYAQPVYAHPQPPVPGPDAVAAQRAQAESDGRIPRVIFGPVIGYSVGVGIGSMGLLIGALAGSCFDFSGDGFGSTQCTVGILAGFFGGMLIGMPLGVTWAGRWFDGMGTYGSSLLGTLAGTGLAVVITAIAQNFSSMFGAALLPLAGAVIGYELSSSSRAQASLGGVSLAPVFDQGRAVGATGGVRIAF